MTKQWMRGLAAVAAAAALSASAEETIVIDGSTTVGPIAKAFAEYYMANNSDVNVTVSESGSGNGAKSLINGTCDIAAMSRAMKDKEAKAAAEKGVKAVQHVVAYDGLAVIVHPSNPVQGLSADKIKAIYEGQITNWKDVGGPDMPIVVISRDTNSGTYETFEGLVMKKAKMGGGVEYVGSNGGARQRVQSTPNAIAYVGIGFLDDTIKPIAVNGVLPTPETVLAKTYPIARELYMYTDGQPQKGTAVCGFLDLCKQDKGKQLIEEVGFIPLQ